ncbi:MAG: Cys-tRNA(Pro) deacylase [Acholeplasmatales bacterium]|jgi:Cys-tRNA(Pro)/Cys-tRNA(Cys) deacylase|nr:Cys-tRNA(Pro) deacylase [Acholeplasmatales bacterium]
MEKTNAIRMLDQKKIKYNTYEYPHEDGVCVDGETVAQLLNQNPDTVFKTLVTVGNDKRYYVCVVPVKQELDLKKAAKAFGVKSLEMIAVKDINNVTGYIRGGCSPIGMKKVFPTIIDESALLYENIIFSGGKIGLQIEMNPKDIEKLIRVSFKEITRSDV